MDDPPAQALRSKRNSSMRVAVNQIKDDKADVVVSAGNTGALMAISRFVLKTLDGIDRPAIATVIPNRTGGVTTMLDLGANVDCAPEHLLQFAVLGVSLVAAIEEKERPTVGLLNIGEEVIKGNEVVKRAAELLRCEQPQFLGNVEGDDIFKGTADVIVCDGFVGNVALKTSEGLAQMLGGFVKEEFTRTLVDQAHGAASRCRCSTLPQARRPSALQRRQRCSGLRGIVIKSHGSADAYRVRTRAASAASRRRATACWSARSPRCSRSSRNSALPPARSPTAGGRAEMSRYSRIVATGAALPAAGRHQRCTAQRLAARGVETSDEWIVARTGIRQRYWPRTGLTTSELGARAALQALSTARARGGRHRPHRGRHVDAGPDLSEHAPA